MCVMCGWKYDIEQCASCDSERAVAAAAAAQLYAAVAALAEERARVAYARSRLRATIDGDGDGVRPLRLTGGASWLTDDGWLTDVASAQVFFLRLP